MNNQTPDRPAVALAEIDDARVQTIERRVFAPIHNQLRQRSSRRRRS